MRLRLSHLRSIMAYHSFLTSATSTAKGFGSKHLGRFRAPKSTSSKGFDHSGSSLWKIVFGRDGFIKEAVVCGVVSIILGPELSSIRLSEPSCRQQVTLLLLLRDSANRLEDLGDLFWKCLREDYEYDPETDAITLPATRIRVDRNAYHLPAVKLNLGRSKAASESIELPIDGIRPLFTPRGVRTEYLISSSKDIYTLESPHIYCPGGTFRDNDTSVPTCTIHMIGQCFTLREAFCPAIKMCSCN